MKISKIREEKWGIGIRYEINAIHYREFIFNKEKLFKELKIKSLNELKAIQSDLEKGKLKDLLNQGIHDGIDEGIMIEEQ